MTAAATPAVSPDARLGALEPDPQGGTPRLVFANQLRGLAAISVVASHLLAVFWWLRGFVALATATPVQPGPIPGFAYVAANPWFMPGPFGVALFFLISGLVIPFSLDRHRTGAFLLARALRIYPTYLAALLIEVLTLHANGWFWGRPFPYDTRMVVMNALLIHSLVTGAPSIDLVNWTLCIELKFYLLLALLAPMVRDRVAWLPAGYGIGLMLLALLLLHHHGGMLQPLLQGVRLDLPYLIFMAIGILFTLHLGGRLGPVSLTVQAGLLLALFAWCWRIGLQANQYPIVLFNYGYALALFAAAFLLRRLARPSRVLDRLAELSYPLYLVHLVVGVSVMKLALLRFGWTPGVSLLTALMVTLAIASLLHRLVERPSIAAGRALVKASSTNHDR